MTLSEFFKVCNKTAIAFSGGVDSAYLLYAAVKHGASVKAYYVKSAFQPQTELDAALNFSKALGAGLRVLSVDILSHNEIASNTKERCYHCKRLMFETILRAAREDGYIFLIDGTNASDDKGIRPGMRVNNELSVLSPLRECGLTKSVIRGLSREAKLFTHDKPSYSCLATRIQTGERITARKLRITESAESFLSSLGFSDFRIRLSGNTAKIELPARQIPEAVKRREEIFETLRNYYPEVSPAFAARTQTTE